MSVEVAPQPRVSVQPPVRPSRRPLWRLALPARQTRMQRAFWLVVSAFLVLLCVKGYGQDPAVVLGAVLIALAAFLPSYLWVAGKVRGLPIFPLYALTATWIYSLPLVYEHPIIILFAPSTQLATAVSVTLFLLLGTTVWFLVGRRPLKKKPTCWMLDEAQRGPELVIVFGVTFLFMVAVGANWLRSDMRIFSLLRAVMLATQGLVCFVLCFSLSQGKLAPTLRWCFYVLLIGTFIVSVSSLLLIHAMSLAGLAVLAYVIGARKVPLVVCGTAIAVFSFLHAGKAPMRDKYWREDDDTVSISPTQYPAFFAEWMHDSWTSLRDGDVEASEPLAQRASLMHLLLYFQSVSPNYLPFLYGESYAVIPIQFIPRIFYPDKPRSLEGSYIITTYYGLQTREDTEITAIDIGLLNESYVNFGYLGMAGLAVILGGGFGWIANWARQMPIFSFRALFGILVLGSILQSSSSAGFYIASLFQAGTVLFCFSLLLMRVKRSDLRRNSFLE